MTKLRAPESGFEWPDGLETYDPIRWPEGRAQWHLARCDAAPSKLLKFLEIRAASLRLWRHDPEQYRADGYT